MENCYNFSKLSAEMEPEVVGVLVNDHTLVSDKQMQHSLDVKGYGEVSKKKFFLKPFESLYLVYCSKLKLTKGNKKIGFDSLLETCIKFDEDALTKFLIYRDLRSRGYIVKDGFGFGSDFRVYERGHFGEKGAKFLVFALSEGRQVKIGKLQKTIEQITQMGKEPIIAVIERRGEVIYYRISRINFIKNNSISEPDDLKF
jgi:tRNA-intron endonuclease, archaea type